MCREPTGLTADFQSETTETRKQWNDIFKVLKDRTCQSRRQKNYPPRMKA